MYLLSITAAARTIDLCAAYFVLDELSRDALLAAMKRGVRVRVIVPGEHIDSETVRLASKAEWGALLAAGAQIVGVLSDDVPLQGHDRRWPPGVGRFNQFRQSVDAPQRRGNAQRVDANFTKAQTAMFESDLRRAVPYSHEQWLQRPWTEEVSEQVVHLFGSQL